MTEPAPEMEFTVTAKRIDAYGSNVQYKDTQIVLDTDLAGRRDAFNLAELLHAVRRDVPPGMESIDYEIFVDSDEDERRLELPHENVKRYGTVFNAVAPGTILNGTLWRKAI
jgi:hypothetical protein